MTRRDRARNCRMSVFMNAKARGTKNPAGSEPAVGQAALKL